MVQYLISYENIDLVCYIFYSLFLNNVSQYLRILISRIQL